MAMNSNSELLPERVECSLEAHGGNAEAGALRWSSAEVFFLEHPLTETMLVVGSDGAVYTGISCPDDSTDGSILRSRDRGRSWERQVPQRPIDGGRALHGSMGTLAYDRASGRLFATSMEDPTCAIDNPWAEKIAKLMKTQVSWSDSLAYSDDGGEQWHVVRGQFKDGGDWGKTFIGPAATLASRSQLQRNGYPNIVYHMAGATFSETAYFWKSLDGGKTFQRTAAPVFSSYVGRTPLPYGEKPEFPAGSPREAEAHTLAGKGVVTADGLVLIPANICGFARLYMSADEGDSFTFVPLPFAHARSKKSFDGVTGFQEPPNGGRPMIPQQPFHAFYGSTAMSSLWSQQLAIDSEGTLYLSWVDALDDLPYLAWSRDRGQSWSAPVCVSSPKVNLASICGIAVGAPGEIAIAYYGSRDAGWTFDGCVTVSADVFAREPSFRTVHTQPDSPIQANRLSEPCEYVGVDFAPDGSVWASFARDTRRIDHSDAKIQGDGNFHYDSRRYRGVVVKIAR
jgi:hypothetical protein